MPNGTEAAGTTADIWSDPNLMSILLGMIGQVAMGEHQQGWQAQLGRAGTMMGQSRKAALAAEEMGKERKDWRDVIRSLIGGGEVGGVEPQVPDVGGPGLSSELLPAGETLGTTEQLEVGQRKRPYGQLSLYDVLGQ